MRERHLNLRDKVVDESEISHWIGGSATSPNSNEWLETNDPAIGEPLASVGRGNNSDIADAVSIANEATEQWAGETPLDRAATIKEWADELEANLELLSQIEALDTGKPIDFAEIELQLAVDWIRYYASVVQANEGSTLNRGENSHIYIRKEPYGVAGQILPWNYPLYLFAWKAGAALAAGNTVVAKPSEEAPLSITKAAQLSEGILPDGALNIVNGYGQEAGEPLASHSDVDKLSFTGSLGVGKEVMHSAADNVTPVTLELGGKSPYLVFPDAELNEAAEAAAVAIFYNTGQSCDAASRILVHESIHDEFVDKFIEHTAEVWTPGDNLESGTTVGPLAFEDQYDKTAKYVQIGKEEGAELIYGGSKPSSEQYEDGWYFEPTVFDDVENDMRIAQEEIFGPVQTIMTFSNYEEAVQLANDVEFGLASGVSTEDVSLAHKVAADLEAGSVWINEYRGNSPGVPFGGYKNSGFGRECAQETISEYQHTKAVTIGLD